MVGHLVVHHALAGDRALLETVQRRCVVLVVHDDNLWIVGPIYALCLALVDLFQLFHNASISFCSAASASAVFAASARIY
ncbi:hypothetical protein SDC9_196538 [bioreactor metagenome]|uniref:Uncharacterized protein n=1 Tax=bioreactor metagenome TaxID=1076179 RepID=A0A645ICB0_9ZZZZ